MNELLAHLKTVRDQLGAFWGSLNTRGKASLIAGGFAALALIAGLVWRANQHDYRTLYADLNEAEAGRIAARLDALGVPFRISPGGGAILAPAEEVDAVRLQLAAEGLPESGRLGFEIFDQSNFGATEFAEKVNFQRALEGELERSIIGLSEVARARVHLTLPKRSVFLDNEQPAKASVIVGLQPGRELTKDQTRAIAFLVASAAEGLHPDRVVVMDQSGRLFAQRFGAEELSDKQLEFKRSLEHDAVRKIVETLEPRLGPGGVRANVAVDVDWDAGEQTEERIDPSPIVLNQQRMEESTDALVPAGAPGTPSNLPRAPEVAAETRRGLSRTSETTNYQSSRTVTRMRIERGEVERMSIAVLVDYRVEVDAEERRFVREAREPEELATIRNLVIAATGARLDRGDTITVESMPFSMLEALPELPEAPPDPSEELFTMEWFRKHQAYFILGAVAAAALAGLVVWWKRRRRMAQVMEERRKALEAERERKQIEEQAQEEEERRKVEEERLLQGLKLSSGQTSKTAVFKKHLEEVALESPDRFARLIRAWLHEDD